MCWVCRLFFSSSKIEEEIKTIGITDVYPSKCNLCGLMLDTTNEYIISHKDRHDSMVICSKCLNARCQLERYNMFK
jgi:hypothetical protein